MIKSIKQTEPLFTTRGITPTETWIIETDRDEILVNKGDTDYFATDMSGKWLSTWYATLVEAANAGLNKMEARRQMEGLK